MVVVAWVSRHEPLPEQIKILREKLGEIKIVQLAETFTDAKQVCEKIKEVNASYAVVVLPLSMIAQLTQLCKNVTLLWAEMVKVHEHSCPGEKCPQYDPNRDVILHGKEYTRHLRFTKFQKIVKIQMITQPF